MLLDKQALFLNDWPGALLPITAGTYNTSAEGVNAYDLGSVLGRDVGSGVLLRFWAQVTTTFVGATATVNLQLVSAADSEFTTSVTVLTQTGVIAIASLVAGYRFPIYVVPARTIPTTSRYLGVNVVTATATITAGQMSAGIALDEQEMFTGYPAVTGR